MREAWQGGWATGEENTEAELDGNGKNLQDEHENLEFEGERQPGKEVKWPEY